ncbi:MAG: hypothetical protein WCQ61_08150, partial [Proteiniphilum sp.]
HNSPSHCGGQTTSVTYPLSSPWQGIFSQIYKKKYSPLMGREQFIWMNLQKKRDIRVYPSS